MRRHTRLSRTGPIRRRGRPRFRGYQRNEPYRKWVRQQGCLIAGQHECWGLIECCHVTSRACGGVDENNVYPACSRAHSLQHSLGIPQFNRRFGVNLRATAERLWATFTQSGAQHAVVSSD